MIPPILIPVPQFCDADGKPLAGGTIETYVPGTSTPKMVWVDPDQSAAQTNPIVLDAAGRCTWYGSGDYRLVLRDAAGNLIWDQQSTTIVSAAMAPVVSAPTIADAVALLGLDGGVSGADMAAAIAVETNARVAADNAEAAARAAADTTLQTHIDAEVARATAAEAALAGGSLSGGSGYAHVAGGNIIQWGTGAATGGSGVGAVTFPIAFPSACQSVQATLAANSLNLTIRVLSVTTTSAAIYIEDTNNTGGKDSQFFWSAFGV